ncbi:M24 family metallopeptidase, partial [Candidatus Halobeggiatoa sp. HSG11]|nr:M24 family metallopeptidase [Candidatus Halobeggiatoa sp. HSG11]
MEQSEFKYHRQKLIDKIGIGGMAILPSTFVQNFYYLTGFSQNAIAVIIPQREQGQYILFCQNNLELYDADDVFSIDDIDNIIPGLLETCQRLYYPIGYHADFDKKIIGWLNGLKNQINSSSPSELVALEHVLYEMRLYKTEAEAAAMRTASQILVKAYERVMQFCQPDLYEYELEAEIVHELIRNGCDYPPYPITVAGDNYKRNYNDNNAILKNNDLVMIDAGVRLNNYTATIARTFPVNGHFSKSQKLIYEVVFKAQQAAINKIYPGNNWIEPHKAATEIITKELIQLDLLIGKFNILIEEEAYKRFYPQQTCHWLGLNIHENCNYKVNETWRDLEPNMVMSVESGIYISPAEDIAEEWWNIGICIKDNILITSTGHEI